MFHIFTIHSHITFLVAYSTIHHLSLNKENVILLCSNYNPLVDDFRIEKSFPTKYRKWFQKISKLNVPKSHDRYISKLTNGKKFIAYVDLMSYYQKILVTHSLCESFNFIEEGNGAYQSFDDLTDLTWPECQSDYRIKNYLDNDFRKILFRVLRGYNLRLLSIPYNYMAFVNFKNIKFYCFSDNSYYNAPKQKKVLLRPSVSDDLLKMTLGISLSSQVIWMDGSNKRYTGLDDSYYHKAVKSGIIKLKEKGIIKGKVFVKLRPNEDTENNFLIKSLRDFKVDVEILPGYLVPEALFIVSNNCTVVGNLSAALEYANCFGHKVYSIYDLFEKKNPTFFDRMDGFWSKIEKF